MRKTPFEPGRFYHVFNRGNEKKNIFFERENYLFFLRRLKAGVEKWGVSVLVYCLMPNHFHLLLQEALAGGITNLMLTMQTSYAKAINKRYQRVGHLFQGTFKNILVDRNEYLIHLSRYIHINPVLAGLAHLPEDWEFSSYRNYVGLRNGKLPQKEIILSQFKGSQDYREFVGDFKQAENIKDYVFDDEESNKSSRRLAFK